MKIVKLTGTVELLSGLHIGGGDDTMKIGGIDNGVVKDVNTDNPYIPGSSLKGKMRSLLEMNYRVVYLPNADGSPFSSKLLKEVPMDRQESVTNLLKLFGDKEGAFGITRISVGDSPLSLLSQEMVVSEGKWENTIDRKTGTAKHGVGARQTERVPAGVKFDFDIRVKILEGDNEDALITMVKKGFELIESDYLGGSGSRGYGRVKFNLSE